MAVGHVVEVAELLATNAEPTVEFTYPTVRLAPAGFTPTGAWCLQAVLIAGGLTPIPSEHRRFAGMTAPKMSFGASIPSQFRLSWTDSRRLLQSPSYRGGADGDRGGQDAGGGPLSPR